MFWVRCQRILGITRASGDSRFTIYLGASILDSWLLFFCCLGHCQCKHCCLFGVYVVKKKRDAGLTYTSHKNCAHPGE